MLESFSSRLLPEGMMANAMMQSLAMPPKKTARFPRTARLLRHADFERVYKEGRRHFSQSMTVFYVARTPSSACEETSQALRVGFTVGRTLGGAVQRNRMKRRLREAVRVSLPAGNIAVDVVINPRKSVLDADFTSILNEVKRVFTKIEQEFPKRTNRAGRKYGPSEQSS
jgi:ribonuclease P protein component